MFTLVIIIHLLVSAVMVGAVLLQAGKGASIGSTFGGSSSQTLFGSAGPTTILTKITYACAAVFMLTSLTLTYMSGKQRTRSIMDEAPSVSLPAAPAQESPAALPEAPAAAPQP